MAEIPSEPTDPSHSMTCMEIWGGNKATFRNVTLPGLGAWVYSRPYQQAESGGDVYYVSNCATGRITRLMLADVSGHGSAVAKIANDLRMLMRRYVNHIQQVKFVSSMNNEFATLASSGGFATAVVATFLAPTRRLTFSNAGHPHPLIYTARDRRWRLLETLHDKEGHLCGPSDLPLGIFEDGDYGELELMLDVGDIVSKLDGDNPETLLEKMVTKVTSLWPGNLTDDDVTLLMFQATGEEAQIPIGKRILAPFRFLKGMSDSLLDGGRGMPLPEFSLANLGGAMFESLTNRATRVQKPK